MSGCVCTKVAEGHSLVTVKVTANQKILVEGKQLGPREFARNLKESTSSEYIHLDVDKNSLVTEDTMKKLIKAVHAEGYQVSMWTGSKYEQLNVLCDKLNKSAGK